MLLGVEALGGVVWAVRALEAFEVAERPTSRHRLGYQSLWLGMCNFSC